MEAKSVFESKESSKSGKDSTTGVELKGIDSVKAESKGEMPVHWSVTPEGAIVARATAYVYRHVVASAEEGGCKEFFEEHCLKFEKDEDSPDEICIEAMDIFKEYEAKMETILTSFARLEKLDFADCMEKVRVAADIIPQAEKSVQLLLAATGFPKFVRLMRMKAKAIRKTEAAKAMAAEAIGLRDTEHT